VTELALEVLVEERSAEAALRFLLPRIVPGIPFRIYAFQGKRDLLSKLPHRLRDYAGWIAAADIRVVVLLDRDDDDCAQHMNVESNRSPSFQVFRDGLRRLVSEGSDA
jgi:hypothetical protein